MPASRPDGEARLLRALALSHVPRWCVVPRLKEQTVADHSYRVAAIAQFLLRVVCQKVPDRYDSCELRLLEHSLFHDEEEAVTGDIPRYCKPENGKGATPLVVLADLIEAESWISMWGMSGLAAAIKKDLRCARLEQAARIGDADPDLGRDFLVSLSQDVVNLIIGGRSLEDVVPPERRECG